MKYINMYYGTKGGYVSGSERFDSAAEAAAKGAKSPNFALVLPYVPKAERGGQVQVCTQEEASMEFTIGNYVQFVLEDGTHKVVTENGDEVTVLDIEDAPMVILKIRDRDSDETFIDYLDLDEDDTTMNFDETLLIVKA